MSALRNPHSVNNVLLLSSGVQYSDREASKLWHQLQQVIPAMFNEVTIKPSLLHGDLWSGNAGEANQEPGMMSLQI